MDHRDLLRTDYAPNTGVPGASANVIVCSGLSIRTLPLVSSDPTANDICSTEWAGGGIETRINAGHLLGTSGVGVAELPAQLITVSDYAGSNLVVPPSLTASDPTINAICPTGWAGGGIETWINAGHLLGTSGIGTAEFPIRVNTVNDYAGTDLATPYSLTGSDPTINSICSTGWAGGGIEARIHSDPVTVSSGLALAESPALVNILGDHSVGYGLVSPCPSTDENPVLSLVSTARWADARTGACLNADLLSGVSGFTLTGRATETGVGCDYLFGSAGAEPLSLTAGSLTPSVFGVPIGVRRLDDDDQRVQIVRTPYGTDPVLSDLESVEDLGLTSNVSCQLVSAVSILGLPAFQNYGLVVSSAFNAVEAISVDVATSLGKRANGWSEAKTVLQANATALQIHPACIEFIEKFHGWRSECGGGHGLGQRKHNIPGLVALRRDGVLAVRIAVALVQWLCECQAELSVANDEE